MNNLTIFIFILIVSCRNSEIAPNNSLSEIKKKKAKNILVYTDVIRDNVLKVQIIANGKIETQQKAELRFRSTNRLATIKVINGQKVVKGQVLAVLDNAILANQLAKAKIELAKTKNTLREEKINYNSTITTILDTTILTTLELKSGFLEAQNNLENAQILYNQTILKAPFTGLVANIETKTSNYITPSDIFCTLIAQKHLAVSFSILENELSFVKNKQEITITSFSNTNKQYRGVITEINPLIDKNGLVKIKAKILNSDASLFDGMHAKIIINQALHNVIIIPKEALVLRSNKEVVFTVQKDVAKWNYVKVLDENSTHYAIQKGLKLGDTIITSGNMNLSHDAKVNTTFVLQNENSSN